MSECNSCSSAGSCDGESCSIQKHSRNIEKIVGVMSGKGGVGKSTIATVLAKELKGRGNRVGLLDADITGPSIPRLMGISSERVYSDGESGIIPAQTTDGIEVMSLNLMVKEESDPVIWRGPMIGEMVKQFYTDVLWSELDYLVIDMPPGTGDVALTAMQSIPIDGVLMVSVPQDMVSMIVSKAIKMTEKMGVDVLGVVQNMSYMICPDCKKEIRLFESDQSQSDLDKLGTELLAEFPMTPDLNRLYESKLSGEIVGKIEAMTDSVIDKLVK